MNAAFYNIDIDTCYTNDSNKRVNVQPSKSFSVINFSKLLVYSYLTTFLCFLSFGATGRNGKFILLNKQCNPYLHRLIVQINLAVSLTISPIVF